MPLTRREAIAFGIVVVIVAVVFLAGPRILENWEMAFLVFIVLPLGIYIATDPERRKNQE